jgi:hypothetical protein
MKLEDLMPGVRMRRLLQTKVLGVGLRLPSLEGCAELESIIARITRDRIFFEHGGIIPDPALAMRASKALDELAAVLVLIRRSTFRHDDPKLVAKLERAVEQASSVRGGSRRLYRPSGGMTLWPR